MAFVKTVLQTRQGDSCGCIVMKKVVEIVYVVALLSVVMAGGMIGLAVNQISKKLRKSDDNRRQSV